MLEGMEVSHEDGSDGSGDEEDAMDEDEEEEDEDGSVVSYSVFTQR